MFYHNILSALIKYDLQEELKVNMKALLLLKVWCFQKFCLQIYIICIYMVVRKNKWNHKSIYTYWSIFFMIPYPIFLINTRSVQMMNFYTCDFFRAFWMPPHGQMCSRRAYTWAPLPLCLQETICGIGVVLWAKDMGLAFSVLVVFCTMYVHQSPSQWGPAACEGASSICLLSCSQAAEMQSSNLLELPFKNFTLEGLWTVCVLL